MPTLIASYKYWFEFGQGYCSQQRWLVLTEKWKKSLDKGGKCGALLTGLSKALDCLLQGLLMAKFHAYVFDTDSLRMIQSYLVGRKQLLKIDNEYSTWQGKNFVVLEGLILDPLLFSI